MSNISRTWQQMECQECGAEKVRTEGGAVLCPNGHGRLLDMQQPEYKRLCKQRRKERWLEKFPVASKLPKRGYAIAGRDGIFVRRKPDGGKGIALRFPALPLEGTLAAKVPVDGKLRVYYFGPVKSRKAVSK